VHFDVAATCKLHRSVHCTRTRESRLESSDSPSSLRLTSLDYDISLLEQTNDKRKCQTVVQKRFKQIQNVVLLQQKIAQKNRYCGPNWREIGPRF